MVAASVTCRLTLLSKCLGTVSQKNTFWYRHPTATRFDAVDDIIPNGTIVGDDEISVWKGRWVDTIQDVGQQIPAFLAFSPSCRVDGIKNRQIQDETQELQENVYRNCSSMSTGSHISPCG